MPGSFTLRAELERLEQEAALFNEPERKRMLTPDQRDTLALVERRIRDLRTSIDADGD